MNYNDTQPNCILDILGTPYSVYVDIMPEDDDYLNGCDGYCDKTTKRIVVIGETKASELGDFSVFRKTTLRHEIVHAFLYESGIDANTTWDIPGEQHPEHMVAWIAIQFPKILKVFKEVDAL